MARTGHGSALGSRLPAPGGVHRPTGDLEVDLYVYIDRARVLELTSGAKQLRDQPSEHNEFRPFPIVVDDADEGSLRCFACRPGADRQVIDHAWSPEMLGSLFAPHTDDPKIGVGAWPWDESQSVLHGSQPLGRDRGERPQGEPPAFDRPQSGVRGHPFEPGARLSVNVDVAGRNRRQIGGKHRPCYGARSRPRYSRPIHCRPVSVKPANGSRQVTPTVSEIGGIDAAAAAAYASSNRSGSTIRRAAFGPRRALACNKPRSVRVRSALVALPADSAVVSCMSPTVPRAPQSNASAMANTAGVQRDGLRADLRARPSLDMMKEPRAISAAPVSSTQPTPAAESTSRAANDMSRATTTSGRSFSFSISPRACRSPPSPSHVTRTRSPLSSRSTEWPSWRPRRIRTDGGSTAATAVSVRWAMSRLAMSCVERGLPHKYTIPHSHNDI